MVADTEELENKDTSEIHAWRLNAREVLLTKNGVFFVFPTAEGNATLFGKDQVLQTSQFRINLDEEHNDVLRGESDGSQPLDTLTDDCEALNDFWTIAGNYIYRHQVEPRVELNVPNVESFPIPLESIDVVRRTNTTLDVLLESRIDDYWNIDGGWALSEPWTAFTHFTVLFRPK